MTKDDGGPAAEDGEIKPADLVQYVIWPAVHRADAEAMRDRIYELCKQRDELVVALRKAEAFLTRYGYPIAARAEVEAIRAAIEKVKP